VWAERLATATCSGSTRRWGDELAGVWGRCALCACVVSLRFFGLVMKRGEGKGTPEEERSITMLLGFSVFSSVSLYLYPFLWPPGHVRFQDGGGYTCLYLYSHQSVKKRVENQTCKDATSQRTSILLDVFRCICNISNIYIGW
jgi:hypothetical protein